MHLVHSHGKAMHSERVGSPRNCEGLPANRPRKSRPLASQRFFKGGTTLATVGSPERAVVSSGALLRYCWSPGPLEMLASEATVGLYQIQSFVGSIGLSGLS